MVEFAFSKYSGCGNDFILIDNRTNAFPYNSQVIARLCRRPDGVGADGLILLEESQHADYKMRIFNADGGEAEMCGNGLRCLKKFALELGITAPLLQVETMERTLQIEMVGESVKTSMGDPTDVQMNILLPMDSQKVIVHYLNTGVPHAIHFVEDVQKVSVRLLGPEIRYHPLFQPKGANANFVQIEY